MSDLQKLVLSTLGVVYGLVRMFGVMVGVMDGVSSSRTCTYNSLMARTNLGYFVACEMAKPRFKSDSK